jgi:hypothetical protein
VESLRGRRDRRPPVGRQSRPGPLAPESGPGTRPARRAHGSVLRLPVLRRAAPRRGRRAPRSRLRAAGPGLGPDRPGILEPRAGTEWTDDGASRQERGLKHRAVNETSSIPIPPALVRILRAHIQWYGTGPGGRLFRTARGGPLNDTGYGEVWQRARPKALTPAQQASLLARRPYDLRHAAVSLWLNAGVPATEVARRAGHGIAVLLKVYANCIDGQAAAANGRISDALDKDGSEGT